MCVLNACKAAVCLLNCFILADVKGLSVMSHEVHNRVVRSFFSLSGF